MPAQIEQLPDLTGYLKLASRAQWQRIRLQAPVPAANLGLGGRAHELT